YMPFSGLLLPFIKSQPGVDEGPLLNQPVSDPFGLEVVPLPVPPSSPPGTEVSSPVSPSSPPGVEVSSPISPSSPPGVEVSSPVPPSLSPGGVEVSSPVPPSSP